MKNKTCPICNKAISDSNDTEEHVIPNSIGGRKKVSGFICRNCNSESGRKWDNEIAQQLNSFCIFFNIKRERGTVPSQTFETVSGQKLVLNSDGTKSLAKPEFSEILTDKGVQVKIKARSVKNAKKMAKGFERKYSQFPKMKIEISEDKVYADDPIKFTVNFGGLNAGRSLTKTTLSLLHDADIPLSSCTEAINYLTDENAEPCFGYLYSFDPIQNRPAGIPLHCVYVKGDPKNNLILGYIEYFGHRRAALCLSKNYEGHFFENSYAINPMDGQKIDLTFDLPMSLSDIEECYNYNLIPPGSLESALNQIMPTAIKLSEELERARAIEDAAKYAFDNCGAKQEEIISEDHYLKLAKLFTEKIMPYLTHKVQKI